MTVYILQFDTVLSIYLRGVASTNFPPPEKRAGKIYHSFNTLVQYVSLKAAGF